MAFNSFLKIATIDGEATAKGYEKHIELASYSHSLSQHSGGSMSAAGGLSGGRVDHGNFTITKPLDSATPKLMQSCCTGEHIKDIAVDILAGHGRRRRHTLHAVQNERCDRSVRSLTQARPRETRRFRRKKFSLLTARLNGLTLRSVRMARRRAISRPAGMWPKPPRSSRLPRPS